MNNVSQVVESNLKALAANLVQLQGEALDLNKYYFSSGASDLVNAAASASTAVTTASGGGLSKNQFLGGINLVGALNNFFTNAAVAQSDYLSSLENLIGGSFTASSPLSNDVEAIGGRLKTMGLNVIQHYKSAKQILALWTASELASAAGALSGTTIVPGCSTPKNDFDSGIGLVTQFINMMENAVVASGYWGQTSSKWSLS